MRHIDATTGDLLVDPETGKTVQDKYGWEPWATDSDSDGKYSHVSLKVYADEYPGFNLKGCSKDEVGYYKLLKIKAPGIESLQDNSSISPYNFVIFEYAGEDCCGDNLTYEIGSGGNLVISGKGDMWDFSTNLSDLPWYQRVEEITSVTISDSVASIGNYAFYGCSSLSSVSIPDSVASIGDYAFYQCTSLSSVSIPDSVASIGRSAFYQCTSLSSVSMPGVFSIGDYAFSGCFNLIEVILGGGDLGIGANAFSGCSGIKSLLFSESYKNIVHVTPVVKTGRVIKLGDNAFEPLSIVLYGKDNGYDLSEYFVYQNILKSYFDDEKWVSGKAAWALCDDGTLCLFNVFNQPCSTGFFGNKALEGVKEVVIGDRIRSIDENAFMGFSTLERVKVGKDVTSIGEGAFFGCFNKDGSGNLMPSLHSLYFSGNYTSGMEHRFLDSGYSKLTIFYSAGDNTWAGVDVYCPEATSLVDLWLYSGAEKSESWIADQWSKGLYPVLAYGECEITYMEDLRQDVHGAYGLIYKQEPVGEFFVKDYRSDGSENVIIPQYLFIGSLGAATYDVTKIGSGAFGSSSCSAIRSITIPSSVSSIDADAFSGCSSLETLLFLGKKPIVAGNLHLPNPDCVIIYTSDFGDSPTEIWGDHKAKIAVKLDEESKDESKVFYTLGQDRTAIVGRHQPYVSDDAVNTSGFTGKDAKIPDFVYDGTLLPYKVIGFDRYAFYKNKSTETVKFGEYIGEGETKDRPGVQDCTFRDMESLKEIKVSNNERYRAFDGALYRTDKGLEFEAKITGAELRFDKVLSVSYMSVDGKELGNIQGFSVNGETKIESIAFIDYSFTDESKFMNGQYMKVVIGLICTDDNSQDCTLTLLLSPLGNKEDMDLDYGILRDSDDVIYVGMTGTITITQLRCPDEVIIPKGGYTLIKAPSNITSFEIHDDAVIIERYAFSSSSIKNVDIKNVDIIGSHAFYNCTDLEKVSRTSDRPLYLEDSAFENCHKLISGTELVKSAVFIGREAFYNANLSGDVCIPESVVYIGEGAFAHNSGIARFLMEDPKGWTITDADIPEEFTHRGTKGYEVIGDMLLGILDKEDRDGGKFRRIIQYPVASETESIDIGKLGARVYQIDPYAFYGSKNIKDVILDDSTVLVGREAFAECSSLEKFAFGRDYYGSDEYRGNDDSGKYTYNIFGNDRALASVTVPADSLDFCSDGNGALYSKDRAVLYYYPAGSTRLSYTVPEDTAKVYSYAFANNTSLKRVVISSQGPVEIGDSAFANCSRLEEVYYLCDSLPERGEKIYDYTPKGLVSYFIENKGIDVPNTFEYRDAKLFSSISELSQDSVPATAYAFVVIGSDGSSISGASVRLYYGGVSHNFVTNGNGVAYAPVSYYDMFHDPVTLAEGIENDYGDLEKADSMDVVVKASKSDYYPFQGKVTLNGDTMLSFVKIVLVPRIEGLSCDGEDLTAGHVIVNLAEMSDKILTNVDGEWTYRPETVDIELVTYTDSSLNGCTVHASTYGGLEKYDEKKMPWKAVKGKGYTSANKLSTSYTLSISHDELKEGDVIYVYLVDGDGNVFVDGDGNPIMSELEIRIIDAFIDEDKIMTEIGKADIDLTAGNKKSETKELMRLIDSLLPASLIPGSMDPDVSSEIDGTAFSLYFGVGTSKTTSSPAKNEGGCKEGYFDNITGNHGNTYRFDFVAPLCFDKNGKPTAGKGFDISEFLKNNSLWNADVDSSNDILKNIANGFANILVNPTDKVEEVKFSIWFAKGSPGEKFTYYRLSYTVLTKDGVKLSSEDVAKSKPTDVRFGMVPIDSSSRTKLGFWLPLIVTNYVCDNKPLIQGPPTVGNDTWNKSHTIGAKLSGKVVFVYDNGKFRLEECDVKGTIAYQFTASRNIYITTPVAVIPIYLSVEFDARGDLNFKLLYDDTSEAVIFDHIDFSLALSLDLRAGIGVEWVSAGIYGKAKFSVDASFIPKSVIEVEFKKVEVKLGGEVGFYFKFLFFSGDLEILKGEWTIYKYPSDTADGLASSAPLMKVKLLASSPAENKVLHQVDPASEVFVYGGDEYLVHFVDVTEDGSKFTVSDSDGNPRFDDHNYQKIRIDKRVGGQWVPWAGIDGEARNDVYFHIGKGADGPVIVYSYKTGKASESDANSYMLSGGLGISYIGFNDLLNGSSPTVVKTATNFYKGSLVYAYDPATGAETVMWTENSDNSVLGTSPYNYVDASGEMRIFPTDANSIWKATMKDGKVKRVAWDLGPVTDLAVLPDGGYAYVEDKDWDISTADDRMMVYDSTKVYALYVDSVDGRIYYYGEWKDADGNGVTAVLCGSEAAYIDPSMTLAGGYSIASGDGATAMVFVTPYSAPVADGEGKQTYEMRYRLSASFLSEDGFSDPITIAEAPEGYAGYSVANLRSNIHEGMLAIHWDYMDGSGNVALSENRTMGLSGDMTVTDRYVDYKSGELVVTVLNTGAIESEAVLTEDGSESKRVEKIPAGTETEMRIGISGSGTILLNGTELGTFSADHTDMRVVAEPVNLGMRYLLVTVFNDGNIASAGTISCGPGILDYGSGLYSVQTEVAFDSIGPNGHRNFAIALSQGIIGSGITTARVVPQGTFPESDIGNNVVSVSVDSTAAGDVSSSSMNGIRKDPVLPKESGSFVKGEELSISYLPNGSELVSMSLKEKTSDDGWEQIDVPKGWKSSDSKGKVTGTCTLDAGTYVLGMTFRDRASVTLSYTLYVTEALEEVRVAWLDQDGAVLYVSDSADTSQFAVPDKGRAYQEWEETECEGYDAAFIAVYDDLTYVVRMMSSEIGKPFIAKTETYRSGETISYSAPTSGGSVYVGAKKLLGWNLCTYVTDGTILKSINVMNEGWGPIDSISLREYEDAIATSGMSGEFALVALYERPSEYTVTFEVKPAGYGHLSVGSLAVQYGTSYYCDGNVFHVGDVEVEAVPASDGSGIEHSFAGWSASSGRVTEDMVVIARFTTVSSETVDAGECGDSLSWKLLRDGTLSIYGDGDMWSWEKGEAPWYSHRASITEISLEGATSIGSYAFYQCTKVKELELEEGVAVLERSAFSRCDGLERIALPDSLETVGSMAFYGLTFLSPEGDRLPQTADNLRGATFEGTGKTLYKQVPAYTITWTNDDGSVIDETSVFQGSVPQHDDAAKASDAQYTYAFAGWSPEIVPAVGDATYAATFIKTLNSYTVTWVVDDVVSERICQYGTVPSYGSIPSKAPSEGMTYKFERWEPSPSFVMGDATYTAVFREVTMLGSGECGDDLTWALYSDGILEITGSGEMWSWEKGEAPWYSHRASITEISLEGATSIGSYAFYQCTKVKELELEEGVAVLERSAFSRCNGFERIVLPDSLQSVNKMAFYGLELLDVDGATALSIDAESLRGAIYEGTGDKSLVRMPPVEVGDEFTTDGLKYRVTSTGPVTASVIGYEGTLIALVVPEDVLYNGITLDVTSIGPSAFYGCTALRSADLGGVSKVDVKAFAQCTKLKTVHAGDRLSTISAYAFAKCTRLVDFDMSGSLKTMKVIGSFAFLKDAKLGGIAVPSFVSTVGEGAFALPFSDEHGNGLAADAASLAGYEYVNVGGTLVRQPGVELGREFSWNGLTLTVTASLPAEVGISGYSGKPKSLVLSGPVKLEGTAYDITSVMKNAFNGCKTLVSADLPGIERLDAQAFYGCSKLESVSAPDLVSVGTKAFCRCTALSDLDLGDSLTTISAYGFWGCTSLESVELPDTVRSLGTYAFQRCSSLSSIDLGESLRLIGTKAFDGTAIVSLEIPDTIVRLKEGALSGCPELREVSFEGGEKVILHAGVFEGTPNIERIAMPDGFKRIYAGALDGITFLDGDGAPLAATAKSLAGQVFAGEGGELALIA